MRKFRLLAAAAALLFATTAANAGALLSATYTQTTLGVQFSLGTPTGGSPTGTLVGNTFSLDAGSAFAAQFCIGATGCAPAPLPPPLTRINFTFTMNGAVTGTTNQASITPASGVMGQVLVMAKIGKNPAFTLLGIPVNAGAGGTVTTGTNSACCVEVQVKGDVWHIGTVTQTGLTNMFTVALPDVMAVGNVSVTAGGNTHVNLVSLSKIRTRGGLSNGTTSDPSYLRLVYAPSVPEPGTLMLLGAGVAGLAVIGRRKMR